MPYGFDTQGRSGMTERGPVPDGWYPMAIIAATMTQTKKGDGEYLELVWAVTDGPHKGQKSWVRLNLVNPNAQAVEIAERELTSICLATGVLRFRDPRELVRGRAMVKLGTRKKKGSEETEQVAMGYRSSDSETPTRAPASPRQSATSPTDDADNDDGLPF